MTDPTTTSSFHREAAAAAAIHLSASTSHNYTFDESEDGGVVGSGGGAGDIHYSYSDIGIGIGVGRSSSSNNNNNNMNTTPTNSSMSKSARYQTALTARARQRQMRRMLEREGSAAGESPGSIIGEGISISASSRRRRGRSTEDLMGGGGSSSSPSTPGNTPNSEVTRLRALLNNSNRSSSNIILTNTNSSENSDHPSPNSQILATLYEKHRSRSLSRTRENTTTTTTSTTTAPSLPTSPSEECSTSGGGGRQLTRSPSTPDLVNRDPHPPTPSLISPPRLGAAGTAHPTNSIPSAVVTPQKLIRHDSIGTDGGYDDESNGVLPSDEKMTSPPPSSNQYPSFRASPAVVPTSTTNESSTISTTTLPPPPPSASALRQQRMLNITPSQEFLPDWNDATKSGAMLSPNEVQDAANFTSIQFQCSMVSGEVEILSGDDASDRCSTNKDQSCWQNEIWSDVSPPSPLASGEIFHRAAAASIVALLSPHRMAKAGLMAPDMSGSNEDDDAAKDVAGDSPTGVIISPDGGTDGQGSGGASSNISGMLTFNGNSDPSLSRGGEWEGVTQVSRSLFHEDVDEDVRQSMVFQAFRGKMIESSEQFNQLLSQINRKRGVPMDRTFAIRRKNACGALKILSAKQENRIKICWTVGVLPAIASVLCDVNEEVTDEITLAANTEARNRIVSTLLNLSVNKKNRMLIVNTPGVLDSISEAILHDAGEGRQGCCTVLLYLAKTSEARGMIVKSAGTMDALAKVIEVPTVQHPKSTTPKSKSKMRKQHLAKILESPSNHTGFSSRSSRSSSVSSHSGSHSSNSASGSEGGRDSAASVDSSIAPGEVEQMEISFATAITTVATLPNASAEDMYDADPNRFLHGARLSVFACLLCLVKSQENAVSWFFDYGALSRVYNILSTIVLLHPWCKK